MATRFLKPRSVELPSQGAHQFTPHFFVRESDTAAGLETLLNVEAGIRATDPNNFWVIEEIEYQVSVIQPMIGGNPPIMSYSALIWATQVEII